MPDDLWYPWGIRDPAPSGTWGSLADYGEPKFLLHTTEGPAGVYRPDPNMGAGRRYYGNTGTWPNYTLAHDPRREWRVYQHIPANRSSLSLRNRAGGVETNRDNVTQVEIAWKAIEIPVLPEAAVDELGRLLAWEHGERGVPLVSTVRWVAYPASYGERASQRLSGPEWDACSGVLGHQHAPENDHGDPGDFPIVALLEAAHAYLEDVMTPDQQRVLLDAIKAVPAAAGKAAHDYLWSQMQIRPEDAPDDWHPPWEAGVGGVIRRDYEMTGAALEGVRRLPGLLGGQPAVPDDWDAARALVHRSTPADLPWLLLLMADIAAKASLSVPASLPPPEVRYET